MAGLPCSGDAAAVRLPGVSSSGADTATGVMPSRRWGAAAPIHRCSGIGSPMSWTGGRTAAEKAECCRSKQPTQAAGLSSARSGLWRMASSREMRKRARTGTNLLAAQHGQSAGADVLGTPGSSQNASSNRDHRPAAAPHRHRPRQARPTFSSRPSCSFAVTRPASSMEAPRVEIRTSMGTFQVEVRTAGGTRAAPRLPAGLERAGMGRPLGHKATQRCARRALHCRLRARRPHRPPACPCRLSFGWVPACRSTRSMPPRRARTFWSWRGRGTMTAQW